MDIEEYKRLLAQRDIIQSKIDYIKSEYSDARLFHIDAYIVIRNMGRTDTIEEIVHEIECSADGEIDFIVAKSEQRDLLWHDDIDLNYINCPIENYEKYFKDDK